MLKARTSEISCSLIGSTLNALQPSSSESVEERNKVGMREMMNQYVSSNDELSFDLRDYPHDSLYSKEQCFTQSASNILAAPSSVHHQG